ncbi:MAG: hypothetical protein SCK29_07540 [Bacillota bacterium]|nr:hypothetical protein [Bacillota bacterium]MDW7683953.1 hypothetical protein [Bacillota bacterium]
MLHKITALLALLQSSASRDGSLPRFWAMVLEADGKTALLETRGERLQVKLETPVHAGEKLFLEQQDMTDGRLQCRILRRLAPQEQVGPMPDTAYSFFYPDEQGSFPYLLAAGEEDGSPATAKQGYRMWQFTLHTENLGMVALLVRQKEDVLCGSLLVENEDAAARLAGLTNSFAPGTSRFYLQGIRVMNKAELTRLRKPGGNLNRLR